ncbi:MAG: Gldg family protein [Calditrichia bacterium]
MKRYAKTAIVVGVLFLIYSFVNFSLNQIWDWVSTFCLLIGIIVGGAGLYYHFKFREKKISSQSLQQGANSILMTVIVLGIIVLLAFITNRHKVRADLTAKGLYSLAEQTKSVLNNLKKDVKIIGFYKKADEVMARDIFEEYSYLSDHVKYEFVDPNQKPQIARRYGIASYNVVVVECNGKRETINQLSESNLTNAIIKVSRELDKVIYFTTGHGEKDIENAEANGYKTAAEGIRKENYLVKTTNLAQEKKLPEDCSVLVIAGPQADFFPSELDTIAKYLERGGKLMVLLDARWKTHELVKFLKDYNIKVGDNIVVDASGVGQLFGMGPEMPLVSKYENKDIFKDFNIMTFYPLVCSVETGSGGKAGYSASTLFKSGPNSWAESDYNKSPISFDEGKDINGPVSLAVLSTKNHSGNKKSRILVIGDSDFAGNAYIRNSGNYDAFLNEINYLAEEEDQITIRPKEIDDRRVNLTAKDSKIVLYVSVFALPLLIIIAGVVIYFRRR